jgi:glycosyltransferase involved in cell wall biosynthesis
MNFATVCVLSYERPDFLRDSLQSMREGAEYPLEIIVHDDGSRDPRVRELLHEQLALGNISTAIFNPAGHNQGQGVALNRLFSMAAGDPIIKADQDLIYHGGWLKRCIEILGGNRSRRSVCPLSAEEPAIGALGLFRYTAEPVKYEEMLIQTWGPWANDGGWEQHRDFVGSAMVIPREVWEAFGPFDQHSDAFAEDREFKMKLKDEGGLALALPIAGDLATNVGFGVGPSTVVVDHGEVAKIKKAPVVIGAAEGGVE